MGLIEILVIIFAAAIVITPIILYFVRRKKGKVNGCGCGCSSCPHSNMCNHVNDDKNDM